MISRFEQRGRNKIGTKRVDDNSIPDDGWGEKRCVGAPAIAWDCTYSNNAWSCRLDWYWISVDTKGGIQ